ncbi:hypothetical protein BS47DRAFT_1367447 [Hydnum rufescens UP504]|uniref:Uncharacterized protein n=1 Tax=Hydnum rufescens UP504 TaxID=1448309 RepID=A0A9P6AK69_9AGAM|nr:hypothetical protein BS47DRAFT_1367447 [Hydnum rufescens UP504]
MWGERDVTNAYPAYRKMGLELARVVGRRAQERHDDHRSFSETGRRVEGASTVTFQQSFLLFTKCLAELDYLRRSGKCDNADIADKHTRKRWNNALGFCAKYPRPGLRRGGSEEAGESLTRRLSQSSQTSGSQQHPNRIGSPRLRTCPKDLGKTLAPPNDLEENVDDPDDVLDQFTLTSRPVPQAPAEAPSQLSEDFSAQLAAGMEALVRDLGQPSSSGEILPRRLRGRQFSREWRLLEVVSIYLQGKLCGPARVEDPLQNVDEFRRTILEAMQRLKTWAQSDSSNLSKDMLYDPLKELHEKAKGIPRIRVACSSSPQSKNEAVVSAEDKTCYKNQLSKIYLYSFLLTPPERQMQSLGSPPEEIIGELPLGMNLNTDGLPVPEGCIIA